MRLDQLTNPAEIDKAIEELNQMKAELERKQNPPVKVALTGKSRSGKSTVANYLVMKYDFLEFAFASPLKHIDELLYGRCPKNRSRLQAIGEKLCEVDPKVFVNCAFHDIEGCDWYRVVISDLRKPVEYEAVKEAGYTIIRVNASEQVRIGRARKAGDEFREEDLQHSTETAVDDFEVDYEITNDGDVSALEDQIDEIMAEMGVMRK